MNGNDKQSLGKLANAIRILSMDAIQAANSGHPGLPLGCAEIGAFLYGKFLRYNPRNPGWLGRDRYVLSAGHGSMLLYSCLHLSGYDLALDELKNFRQLGSRTAGHPEYGETPGVETTTGPLGQGIANAAGMALANKLVAARLGAEDAGLLDGLVIALAGDGCMMEGITHETASLAAHLRLDNLVVIYDSNDVCLDGPTSECFSEDSAARYRAYGWDVTTIDGHDFDRIRGALEAARARKGQPSFIIARTTIGKGSPNKAGTSSAHGAPLGEEEVQLTKEALGVSPEPFHVPDDVYAYTKGRLAELEQLEEDWNGLFRQWAEANPEAADLWRVLAEKQLPEDADAQIRSAEIAPNAASRKSSNATLQKVHDVVPFLVGGSADLSCSDLTMMKASAIAAPGAFDARNVKFGVREFAMSAMCSGMALQGMVLPLCGTFLTFSDYMRNAIRMAALMRLRVIYQFTHDSIGVGEDGPTHQPVEHVAALRAIPGLTVIRPADSNEVKAAWSYAVSQATGPVALILSRQGLPDLQATNVPTAEGLARGAYVVLKESSAEIDCCLLASGSEVSLALAVAENLVEQGKSVRVVSVPSFELFDAQDAAYRDSVLGAGVKQYWSLEAGVELGWHKYIGRDGQTVAMSSFGVSAPGKAAFDHFGFTVEKVLARIAGAS